MRVSCARKTRPAKQASDQVIRENPASRGTEKIGRGSCQSARADGVERRFTAVVRGQSEHSNGGGPKDPPPGDSVAPPPSASKQVSK